MTRWVLVLGSWGAGLVLIALSGAVPSTLEAAHHPLASTYLVDRTQAIEGKVVSVQFRNPHSFVIVETSTPRGQAEEWTIEWLSWLQLSRQGVTGETLKPGDDVLITGYPARNPDDRQMHLRTISRPKDGWTWRGTFE